MPSSVFSETRSMKKCAFSVHARSDDPPSPTQRDDEQNGRPAKVVGGSGEKQMQKACGRHPPPRPGASTNKPPTANTHRTKATHE